MARPDDLPLHLIANPHYDVFRDELYFIVCGLHPAFGYVDQPPLIPLIAAASFKLFGTALLPLRFVPALANAATVALTADFARQLGGGRFAQVLAGLCTLLAPALVAGGVLMSTDALQPLTWLACAWIVVRVVASGDERWWLAFGLVAGVSLESKYLIAFYLVGLAVGGLATPLRRSLTRPWIYAGAAIGLAIALPNIVWQAAHGWPFIAIGLANATRKSVGLSPIALMAQQALFVGPAAAPVWLAGLWRLGVRTPAPQLRALAIAYVVVAAIVVLVNGKAYYATPIYPSLFAAGAVAWEGWLRRPLGARHRDRRRRRSRPHFGADRPADPAARRPRPLHASHRLHAQDDQDRKRGAFRVAAVLRRHVRLARDGCGGLVGLSRLPPDERAEAVFYAPNYGEASALTIYGPALGGPPTISAHNSYFMWGTGGASGAVVITLGREDARFDDFYSDARAVGRIESRFAMPYEIGLTIWVLRQPRASIAEVWPKLRHFD